MTRFLKYIAWLLAGFVALFAIAAVALYVFFDPNDFREDISAAVKEETGRDLLIEGDISLSVFPWLAVEVDKVSLGAAAGFGEQPIASFDSAKFSVRLLPVLLRQEIIVGAADIDALQLNLKVDSRGRSNWSDLVPDETADADAATGDTPKEVDVNRIEISNATISYNNDQSGERYVADDMNIRIGRLKGDGLPVPLTGTLRFDLQPAALSGDLALDTVLAFDAESGLLVLDGLDLEGTIEGVAAIATTMNVATDRIEIATGQSQVSMQPLDLTLLDLHMTADVQPFSYEGRVTPKAALVIDEFSPRKIMTLFDVEPPLTADAEALSSLTVTANAQLLPSTVQLSGITIKLDDTTFSGTMSVPREPNGAYEFELVGDRIRLDRYMEPVSESAQGSSDESVPTEIPTDLIKPLNARGKLKITQATLSDIVFENVDLGLNASAGRLRLFPVSAGLFGGSYRGDVRVDVSGSAPKLSFDEKLDGVDLASLAKAMFERDNITGTITGAFKLSGSGNDVNAIQRSLSGDMSFNLQDGTFEGTDVWYELRKARAKLKGEEPPEPVLPARTEFSTVRATGRVTSGVLQNNDLFAELPHMQVTGAGTVDLAAARIDYGLNARILERPELLEGATAEELDEFTEAVIPLRISGPLASPDVKPDIQKLLKQQVQKELKDKEEEIKDKIEDKLKDLFK